MNPQIPESLLAYVRGAYPPGAPDGEYGVLTTPQLEELVRNAQPQLEPKWKHLLSEVERRWPDRILWNNTYLPLDPSFRLRLYAQGLPADVPRDDPRIYTLAMVVMVSAIAPVHHLYISLLKKENNRYPPPTLLHARDLWPASVRDDAWFLEELTTLAMGTSQLPLELLEAIVPPAEVASRGKERQVGEYLFGRSWW